jgi:dipeptidyl aminopeptidase/acylaminoacyl peptidase
LVDIPSGAQTDIARRFLSSPREERVTDVRWSPTGQQVAIETAGDEHGLIYVLDLRADTVKPLNIEGTAGSRTPRWDAPGHWLYFVPGLLSLDMTEDGLFGYDLSRGRVWKMLSDTFVAERFAIAGDTLLGVSPLGSTNGPRLFSVSLADLRKQAKEVARWDAAESRFISIVNQGKDR